MKRRHLIIHLETTLTDLQALAAAGELQPGKIYLATDTEELYRPKTSNALGSGFTEATDISEKISGEDNPEGRVTTIQLITRADYEALNSYPVGRLYLLTT